MASPLWECHPLLGDTLTIHRDRVESKQGVSRGPRAVDRGELPADVDTELVPDVAEAIIMQLHIGTPFDEPSSPVRR
ncbi:MAG: hypothetical protein ACRDTD_15200 [Pseudonocardiaceae bacterium]